MGAGAVVVKPRTMVSPGMPKHELVGLVLIAVGVAEPMIGFMVASRIPNPASGAIVKFASVASAVLLVGFGVAFYSGMMGLG